MNAGSRSLSFLTDIVVGLLSFVLAVPLFILAYYRVPDLKWPYHSDKTAVFLVIAVLLLLMVRSFKFMIITGVIATIGWLWYGTATGQYGFKEFYQDGKSMLLGMESKGDNKAFVFSGSRSLSSDHEILNAIDYKNPVVRDFAVRATNQYFRNDQESKLKYRTLVQCFAVFKKVNKNWNYVSDPQNEEYIAKASESVKLLAGDCDDHSVLMAAAVKAIGGVPRLVYTEDHIYPELLVGNEEDLDYVNQLIHEKLFPNESDGETLHYHKDEDGNIWLNLDYTAHYPGGKFLGDEVIECIYP